MNSEKVPPSRKPQVGLKQLPTEKNRVVSSDGKNSNNIPKEVLQQYGIANRVAQKIPIPSEATPDIVDDGNQRKPISSDDVPQWEEPESSNDTIKNASLERDFNKPIIPQIPSHPVLAKLRNEFGLSSIEHIRTKIKDTIWTLSPVSQGLLSYAIRLADSVSASVSEHAVNLSILKAACSVVAIDNVPLWKVFEVRLNKNESMDDEFDPPIRMRQVAIAGLYDLLAQELQNGIAMRLLDVYNKELEPLASINLDNEQKANYRCSECNTEKWFDENRTMGGELEPYYCEKDGTLMEPILTKDEAGDYPLD